MEKIVSVNYLRLLRAYNKVESAKSFDNKIDLLRIISSIIDKTIQDEMVLIQDANLRRALNMKCPHEEIKVEASFSEIESLLQELKQNDISLYNSISNRDALIAKSSD